MKKKEIKNTTFKKDKIPNNPKDFIPNNLIDKLIPQSSIYIPNENQNENKKYKPLFIPNEIPEEWEYKSTEEINEEIYLNKEEHKTIFSDEDHEKIISNMPLYLIQIFNNSIEWERPSNYIPNYYIDKEIKKLYPKKNYTSMRENIKAYYQKFKIQQNLYFDKDSDSEVSSFLNDDENSMKKAIYKDFFIFLEKNYDFKVVNYENKIESNEEYEQRIINQENKEINKNNTKLKNLKKQDTIIEEKDKNNKIKPSFLSMKNFIENQQIQNSYYTWLTSIFQMIIDNNINDIETGKSIFLNIYPQNNNIPIYNPQGKYIIKLYLMGKPRKIIIDDRIPCNRYNEYILPQCNLIEEIWPALFIKALIKLNMYKSRHPFYYNNEEFMDNSLIYELTGMHSFILDMNESIINVFKNHFKIQSDKNNEKNLIENNNDNQKDNINEKEKNTKNRKSVIEMKDKLNEQPIINFPLEEKYYYAIFNFQKSPLIKMESNYTYYDIIELIDRQNQKNGTYINQQNYTNNRVSVVEKSNLFKLSSKLLNKIEIKNDINKTNNSNENLTPRSDETKFKRTNKKSPSLNQKEFNISQINFKKSEKLISSDRLISNFLYTICDFFNNGKFNMKRLKFLDFSDLEKDLINKKVPFKQLALNEKKQYLLDRQKLRREKLEEKYKRLKELKEDGIEYTLIKLINQSIEIHDLKFFKQYTEEEIKLAKKCILNNWKFPPPETFQIEFKIKEEEQNKLKELITKIDEDSRYKKEIEKLEGITRLPSMSIKGKLNKNKPIGLFAWTKETYIEYIGNDLKQYEERNENPKVSNIEGCWIDFNDIMNNFNKVLIIENQNKIYHDKLLINNSWDYYKNDCFEPLIDYNIFLLEPNTLINFPNSKFSLIVIFEPYTENFKLNSKIENVIYPYISFDLIEKNSKCIIQKNIVLKKFYSIYTFSELEKNKEYFIKINGGEYPTGYILQIMTEGHKIKNMSFNNFLLEYENFLLYENQISIPVIEKDKYYQIAKFILYNEEEITNEYVQIRISVNYDIKYLKDYILIFFEDENFHKKIIELDKIIKINKKNFSKDKIYTLTFSIKTEENLSESEIGIKILYNESNLKFEYIEEIEPFQINDKYIPNKKGLLFSYYIYPSDKIFSTFNINLYHIINEIKEENNTKKKNNDIQNLFIQSKPIEKECKIIIELYKLTKQPSLDFCPNSIPFSYSNQGTLVKRWNFYNEIIISNLILYGESISNGKKIKNEKVDDLKNDENNIHIYELICYFDISEIDKEILENKSNDIGFSIRIFSSNNIGFIKDNSKDLHEKLIKEKWENNDSGRTLRASKSRKRFLLSQKLINKENLNDQEKKELEEKRKRKTLNQIELNKENDEKNSINDKKKIELKNHGDNKKIEDKKEENDNNNFSYPLFAHLVEQKSFSMSNIFKRKKPNYNKSLSKYITNYVNYSLSNRTIYSNNTPDNNISKNKSKSNIIKSIIMNDEKREKKKKSIIESYEKSQEKYKKEFEKFNGPYSELNTIRNLNKNNSMFRLIRIKEDMKLLSQRNYIKDFIKKKFEVQERMNDMIKEFNNILIGNNDFDEILNVYKESIKILGKNNENVIKFFDFISKKKEEIIQQELVKLSIKDKPNIIKILEDIEYNKWNINYDLIKTLKDIIKEE